MKNILLIILAAFVLMGSVQAANTDRYYQGTMTVTETFTQVTYKWVVTIGSEATDQLHSPAIKIADCNANYGIAYAIVNSTSDVNVIWHWGTGASWATAVTPGGLDATSSTTKTDTIGVNTGAQDYAFQTSQWGIIEIDYGSSACEAAEIVTIELSLRKDKNFIDSSGKMVPCTEIRKFRSEGWTNP